MFSDNQNVTVSREETGIKPSNLYYENDGLQWPARATSNLVKGMVGSMSETFNAGRQEASWGLLCCVRNSKPKKRKRRIIAFS